MKVIVKVDEKKEKKKGFSFWRHLHTFAKSFFGKNDESISYFTYD